MPVAGWRDRALMQPPCLDLFEIFGDLATGLPSGDNDVTLSRDNLPNPPERVSTNLFWFRRPTFHLYDGFPVPLIDLCTNKEGCRLLGLLILASVFHQRSDGIDLELNHHTAQVDLLRIRGTEADFYYRTKPDSLSYWPSPLVQRYPAWGSKIDATELPMISITTRDEMGVSDMRNWLDDCDTVVGFGHDRASVRMARLLLDIGLEATRESEFNLFGEASGYRGVAAGSAELRVWLPGALGYVDSE